MRLVLFDVDGTLVDSQATIHECMCRTFAAFGRAGPSPAAVRAIIGLSLDHAIERLLGGWHRDIASMTALYKRHWLAIQDEAAFAVAFFPGMRELLATLSQREELALGMVTGKSRRGIEAIISAHGLERTFLTARTADDCPSKPHPAMVLECCAETGIEPASTVVIGDTGFDMEMARAAGARPLGVGWGYHPREALAAAGAERVAETADDILAFLASLEVGRPSDA
ncbi:MAG: phosphoglycolate phosphatase [Alphaproteobacteria bacterium]|nr:MAG: phosphoglycolate phosphatase [Alphaproteobacteria bacterium]